MDNNLISNQQPDEITLLKWPDCVRERPGMYISSTDKVGVNNILREIIDNSTDEAYQCSSCNTIFIDRNFNGFNIIADNGRGISIKYSKDAPSIISADLSISALHSGSKWSSNTAKTTGMNGVGSSAVNAVSEDYILMSKITIDNYNQSLPQVKTLWESQGPRSKKELFYIVWYQKGHKVYEGALKKADIEKMIFGPRCPRGYTEIPGGYSTIVMFKPDPLIFQETIKPDLPIINLKYFLLIQEKFYKKKVRIIADGNILDSSGWNGYQFNILKQIIPQDTSLNKTLELFVSFEMDPNLGPKEEAGSVNGLSVDGGVHINYVETAIENVLKDEYKIKHRYAINGLKICVILLASEVVYNSQTKEKLKSISKVKSQDVIDGLTKDIQKIIRQNKDYWDLHVEKVNYLANSMKSLSSIEKAEQLKVGNSANSSYKIKNDLKEEFVDATAGSDDRWKCTLFMCFTGDTEVLTCNNSKITMIDLVSKIENNESIYTFSCTSNGHIKPAKIIGAKKIKNTNKLCIVELDNGEIIKCTPDHKFLLRDGTYKEAKDLLINESLMPCYITESNNYDEVTRRVVLDMSHDGSLRNYRPDEFSLNNNGKLVPIFHIMSKHSDAIIDSSSLEPGIEIHRHHIDHNKFNDYPTNLLLCSGQKHFSFHSKEGSDKAHELAHQNSDLYRRMYVDNHQTESFKKKAKEKLLEFYSTDLGQEFKELLHNKAIDQWSSEELRNWRSEETKKYAKEHPEWVSNNKILAQKSRSATLVKKIVKLIETNNKPKTSFWFNYYAFLLNIKENTNAYWYFDQIFKVDSALLADFLKESLDDKLYIISKVVLDSLKSKNLAVTKSNFNAEEISLFNTSNKGIDYYACRRNHPNIFSKYEATLNNNHKITSIKIIDVIDEPVYCIEVDTPEHNFPLASGVFVKNCEGLSPGGALISGRTSAKYQAILPLKGRPLSTSGLNESQMLENIELYTLFKSIGLGLDCNSFISEAKTREEAYEILKKNSRYGKIVIATD